MTIFGAQIYVVSGKAYLPTLASVPIGWLTIGPVIVCQLDLAEICHSIESLRQIGHSELTAAEFAIRRKEHSPLLKATRKRSWKQLAQTSDSYSVVWTENEISLHYKRQDGKKGAWEGYKTESFPVGTGLESIVQLLLDDVSHIGKCD